MYPPRRVLVSVRYPVVVDASAEVRLGAARAFVEAHAGAGVLIVGATRAASDELAIAVTRDRGALVGVARMSFGELAMRLALPVLSERLVAPGGALGAEAIATRAAFDAHAAGELTVLRAGG